MTSWAGATALLVVAVQKGWEDAEYFGERSNPSAERNIASLLAGWTAQSWPIVYIAYDAPEATSPLLAGRSGNEFKDFLADFEPSLTVRMTKSSPFYGEPDLDGWLRAHAIPSVAVCGIPANTLCESTARMASDLGYGVLFIPDAMHTFDLTAIDGTTVRGREVARISALNIASGFGSVVYTADLVD